MSLKGEPMIVTIEEDEHGNLILPVPQGIIDQMGWDEQTILHWEEMSDGTWSISSKDAKDN